MSPHLCWLLVALHSMAAATPPSRTCKSGGEQKVVVDGWPALVGLRVPVMAQVTMNLSLSHDHKEHTHLTLTHQAQKGKVGLMEVALKSQMAASELHMAALLPDSTWATLKIITRHKELELKIISEIHSTKYSSSASLNTTHHLHISEVSCTSPICKSYIDLKCRYSKSNHTKEHKTGPDKKNPVKGVYYWWFYVVMVLMVMACLLFLVWRNERKKFRTRWLRHSQNVRRISSIEEQVENPSQANRRGQVGTSEGQTNMAYDNTGDADN